MSNAEALTERLLARNRFWRRLALAEGPAVLILAAVVGGLVADRIYTAHHPPEPRYFFTDSHGNLVESWPMNAPVMSDSDMVDWVGKVAVSPYNFDWVHFDEQLGANARPNFTIRAWNGVVESLKSTKDLVEIVEAGMVASATPEKPPVLKGGGEVDGVLTWIYEVPIKVLYRNAAKGRLLHLTARITVIRVPPSLHPKGIAVDGFITKPT